jgi:DNA-binding transcriptional LysR family regulator
MTLVQLKYALAVASFRSINEAATSLFVTQPTISTAIKELETELGVRIFNRTNHGIDITQEGIEFLGFARQVLAQADLLKEHFTAKKNTTVRFVVSSQHYSFAVSSFIRLVKEFGMEKYDFCLRETRTRDIIEDVKNLSADIGIIYFSKYNSRVLKRMLKEMNIVYTPLARLTPHVFISSKNELCMRDSVTLADLRNMPFLSFEQGGYSADYFAEEVLKNPDGTKSIRVSDRATLFNLLTGLNGYTISSGVIENDLDPQISSVPLVEHGYMDIVTIRHKDIAPSPLIDAYVRYLKEALPVSSIITDEDAGQTV